MSVEKVVLLTQHLSDCVIYFPFLHLQFQNNNNYMNMAEANGALLAAGDVSTHDYFFSSCSINLLSAVNTKM